MESQFQVKPTISEFDSFQAFSSSFLLGPDDVIFTEKHLYERYMAHSLQCRTVFLDDFGLGEPSDIVIDEILKHIGKNPSKRIIGIGGGSVLDITKLLCMKDATTTADIFDDRIAAIRDKEMILIPTTCGTGCEMTCVSVVDMTSRGTKMGKRLESNFADHAVLIPQLLDAIPEKVFLYSSVDALIHALEIFVAPTSNPFNEVFCRRAIEIIVSRYAALRDYGLDKRFDYINDFLRASTFAGIALANTACGAVHALAMHFGSRFHVPHGESNRIFLNPVFRRYTEKSQTGKIVEVAKIIGDSMDLDRSAADIFGALDQLINSLIPAKKLGSYGAAESDISTYADTVLTTQQRLLKNNFVPLEKQDLLAIYRDLL